MVEARPNSGPSLPEKRNPLVPNLRVIDGKLRIEREGLQKALFTPRPISLDKVASISSAPELGRKRPTGLVLNGTYMLSPQSRRPSRLIATLLTKAGVSFYDIDLLAPDEQKDNTVVVQLKRGFYRRWVINVSDAEETAQEISDQLNNK